MRPIYCLRVLCLAFTCLTLPMITASGSATENKREQINVAIELTHPPFVIDMATQTGLTYDMLKLFNSFQSRYKFVPIQVPTRRLRERAASLNIDMIALIDVDWGWRERGAIGSLSLTDGMDVFIARKAPTTQTGQPDLAAVVDFYYQFAEFSLEKLSAMPNVQLVSDESTVVEFVLRGRVRRGVVGLSTFNWLSLNQPEIHNVIKVLPSVDHHYSRQLVVLPNASIDIQDLNNLLLALEDRSLLKKLFATYGLQAPPLRPDTQQHSSNLK